MSVFKEHKIAVNQLLGVIPEALLTNLSQTTKVDHYSKVLHGKKLFYLLMYGILENEKLSQRTLEDTFNDSVFKLLFSLDEDEKIRRSSVTFICRAKENRKYVELETLITEDKDLGESILIKDSKVQLYTGIPINNKRGNIHYREELVSEPFRLIIAESKTESGKQYWFLTNDFDLSAKDIAQAYRRRWDIEIFFRFIKQELNVSHLVSLNKNGIQVMLYMTLIVAMLILVYKKANNIGYKTAKRRFSMEIRNLAISLIVLHCGGNPELFFKT